VGKQRLYDAYSEWCESGSLHPLNRSNFNQQLTERGYMEGRNKEYRFWIGLALQKVAGESDF